MIGGIEGGGTTFRCAVAEHPTDILAENTVETRDPEATLAEVFEFFNDHPVDRIGIASFGPVCLDAEDFRYGHILETPKKAWQQVDILGQTAQTLDVPCAIDTDVAAAARAEWRYGAAKGTRSSVYITVGTGIGAASIVDGRRPIARFHEEMGHMLLPRHPDDAFESVCRHPDCLEGLASATAVETRWEKAPQDLPDDHAAWAIEAFYLAAFCVNVTRMLAPDVILFGGGVAQRTGLIDGIRSQFAELMQGYHTVPAGELDTLIQRATLEPDAGLIGALTLAHDS